MADTTTSKKFLDYEGLAALKAKNDLTYAASGHTHAAYENQNAFSHVMVGDTDIAADSTTDSFKLVAGTNVTLTPNTTDDSVTINAAGYSLPLATSTDRGGVKVGYTQNGKNYAVQLDNEKMFVNVPWTDTTYSDATASVSGLMPSADKTKLDKLTMDNNGIIAAANLPSYVDDVLEGYYGNGVFYKTFNTSNGTGSDPYTGEDGKIYVDLDTNKTYRWSGSAYVEISASLALGETASTAYPGDKGADAYKHAVTNKGKAYTSGLYKITTNDEGHVTAATAVAKTDITGLGIPGQDTTYSVATASSGGSGGTDGLMSAADKEKLNALSTAAEANQNAFSNVKVGTTTIEADSKTDTLEIVAGTNVTITPDATNDKITINAVDTTYSAATASTSGVGGSAGLMTAADKEKLDGIATGANLYTLPKAGTTLGGVQSGGDVTITDGIISVAAISEQEINALFTA